MEPTRVAMVGMGTVGTGVAKILLDHHDRITRHAGRPLQLARIVVRDTSRPRGIGLPAETLTDRLDAVTGDRSIRIVAQLVGGLEPARTIMLRLLESGKDVVTANKALLAEHGEELFDRARQLGRAIAFEASVAGGVPIVTNIGQCLSANQITSLRGILNGTSNFIISQMEERGADYGQAVREAQQRGYAEADPAMDVDGSDAAQKLAILAHLAFGAHVKWNQVPRVGIDRLDLTDLRWARDLGYRIKLLAVAQLVDGDLEVHVSPTLVRAGTPLAEVRGANNAISVVGDMVGRVFYHGLGAGQLPTASAVVADLIDMALGRAQITFRTLELWSPTKPRVALSAHDRVRSRFYFRFRVEDHPGVLAQIANVLGEQGISIASVIQRELPPVNGEDESGGHGQDVSLVIMTHTASEGAAAAAVRRIDQLTAVRPESVRIRVLD